MPIVDLNGGVFEVFDEEVLSSFEVPAFFWARAEGFADGQVCGEEGLVFAGPVELVAFGWAFDEAVRAFLGQEVEIDGGLDLAVFGFRFGYAVGKEPATGVDEFVGLGCVFVHGLNGILDFYFLFRRRG